MPALCILSQTLEQARVLLDLHCSKFDTPLQVSALEVLIALEQFCFVSSACADDLFSEIFQGIHHRLEEERLSIFIAPNEERMRALLEEPHLNYARSSDNGISLAQVSRLSLIADKEILPAIRTCIAWS